MATITSTYPPGTSSSQPAIITKGPEEQFYDPTYFRIACIIAL